MTSLEETITQAFNSVHMPKNLKSSTLAFIAQQVADAKAPAPDEVRGGTNASGSAVVSGDSNASDAGDFAPAACPAVDEGICGDGGSSEMIAGSDSGIEESVSDGLALSSDSLSATASLSGVARNDPATSALGEVRGDAGTLASDDSAPGRVEGEIDASDSVVAPALVAAPGKMAGRTKNRPRKGRLARAMAACLAVCAIGLAGLGYNAYATETAYATVEAQSPVQLGVNRFNQVVSVQIDESAYDAHVVDEAQAIKGCAYEDALAALFDIEEIALTQNQVTTVRISCDAGEQYESLQRATEHCQGERTQTRTRGQSDSAVRHESANAGHHGAHAAAGE